jgi:capsular exopolysaccharide synthesis family protein
MQPDNHERSLTVLPETSRTAAYAPIAYAPAAFALPPETDTEPGAVPLSHYLWVFKRHRWKILAFVAACVTATLVISARITPIYEATATVDVDRQIPPGVVGQDANRMALNDADQFLATQIRLIQSDSVLRPVAEQYRLLEHEGQTGEPARPGQPAPLTTPEEAPVLLKRLKVSRPPSTYLLLISYRSPDPRLAAHVSNGIAASYLAHTYNIRIRSSESMAAFMEKQLEELRAKMERSSMALAQFEREMNVINPEEKTTILSARLLQLNTEYTNAQADRVRKETIHASVQTGTMEAALTSQQGEDLRKLTDRLNEANERFVQVKTMYGAAHPEYRKAAAQVGQVQTALEETRRNIVGRVGIEFRQAVSREAMLLKAVSETKAEFDRLNNRSFEYQSLKREAEADKKLYEELVRKIREAGINAGFQNSAIRLADPARPPIRPVFPNVTMNAALALLISSLIALGAALVSDLLDTTVREPEQVSRSLNTEVIGTLPSVKGWRGRLALSSVPAAPGALVRSGQADQAISGFEEAIRTLRNSILLSDVDRRLKSLLVTSAAPGEGKSTAAAHLALIHAEQGRRTLLIDGDLRRPSLHRRFEIHATKGLSNVLTEECSWRELLVPLETAPDLHILPAGPPSRRASDLIGRGLQEVLEEAADDYDLIVLDGPPLPGFAEPLQMAAIVDGVVVVTRAGQTSRKAVAGVLASLRRLRANIVGVVLNEVQKELSESYYYYGHYSKYYRAETKA